MIARRIVLSFMCISCTVICAEAKTDTPVRLGVMKFLARSDGVTDQQAAAIGDIFGRLLTRSPSMTIVERDRIDDIAREHKLMQSGQFEDDAVIELGKFMSCKYMLVGAVTNLERKISETDLWLLSSKRQEITATIDVRVIEVTTSKVIMAFSESGYSSRKGEGFNFYGFKTDIGKTFNGIEEAAIAEAVFRVSFKIREALGGDRIQVVDVTAKELTVNAGKNWGIGKGNLFGVYSEGLEVKNLDGSSMGRKKTLLAVVRVSDVQEDFCYAQILKNGGKASSLHKGDKLEPLTKKEVDALIRQKFFSKPVTPKGPKKRGK